MSGEFVGEELRRVVAEHTSPDDPPFVARWEKEVAARGSELIARERRLAQTEEKHRDWTKRLGAWEQELRAREQRLSRASQETATTEAAGGKVGRNQRCPCGSGRKYKRCHGSADRRQ